MADEEDGKGDDDKEGNGKAEYAIFETVPEAFFKVFIDGPGWYVADEAFI